MIGHEQVGDERGTVLQILRGTLGCVIGRDGGDFDDSVEAALRGDQATVRRLAADRVPLAEDPGAWTKQEKRVGNSQQHIRLTIWGWALGGLVRPGFLSSPAEVAAWIHRQIEAP